MSDLSVGQAIDRCPGSSLPCSTLPPSMLSLWISDWAARLCNSFMCVLSVTQGDVVDVTCSGWRHLQLTYCHLVDVDAKGKSEIARLESYEQSLARLHKHVTLADLWIAASVSSQSGVHQPARWRRDSTCVPTVQSVNQTHQLPDSSLMLVGSCDLVIEGRVHFMSEPDFITQVCTLCRIIHAH